jgi:hypothetical protein
MTHTWREDLSNYFSHWGFINALNPKFESCEIHVTLMEVKNYLITAAKIKGEECKSRGM